MQKIEKSRLHRTEKIVRGMARDNLHFIGEMCTNVTFGGETLKAKQSLCRIQ